MVPFFRFVLALRGHRGHWLAAGIVIVWVLFGGCAKDERPRYDWDEVAITGGSLYAIATEWPATVQAEPRHARLLSYKFGNGQIHKAWEATVGEPFALCVQMSADSCFAKDNGGVVVRVEADTGKIIWRVDANANTAPHLPIGREHIYAATTAGQLRAIQIADGRIAWTQRAVPNHNQTSSLTGPVIAEGYVAVLEWEAGSLYCFKDGADGTLAWESRSDARRYATLGSVHERLIVAGPKAVQGIEPASGHVVWTIDDEFAWAASVSGVIDAAYLVMHHGRSAEKASDLVARGPRNGQLLFSYTPDAGDRGIRKIDPRIYSTQDAIIALTHNPSPPYEYAIVAVSKPNGTELWRHDLGADRIGRGAQVIAANGGNVWVVARGFLWTWSRGNTPLRFPTPADVSQ
jgi:outer membrane protein assembly factor BamB